MQATLLAAALFASVPVAATAQSGVAVYGVMDAAIAAEDTGAANGGRTVVNSGNQSSSRLGFRATEDLGHGLTAMFNIEAGLALDTGAADSTLFGRRSVVGLQGRFGAVMVGREYTPIADIANATDIMGQGFYGSNLNAFTSGRLTRRISNSVNYKSHPIGGVKFGAAYGIGETPAGPSLNLMGIAAEYTNGTLYLGAGYHTFERLAAGDDKERIFGAGCKIGPVDLKASRLVADPAGANNRYEQINIGASYAIGANKVFANYQRDELEHGATGNGFAVAYSYTLSKRTNLYASYATIRNNQKGLFGLNAAGSNVTPPATAPGADPKALSLGLRHAF